MAEHVLYEYVFSPDDPNNTASAVYRLARAGGKRVLDLGSGPGIVSSRLARDDGRDVTCVDHDPRLLARAAERGVGCTILADLAGSTWIEELEGQFDVVILADVLEHLMDPGAVLDVVRERLLADDGFAVVSIPNASHEAVVAQLIAGRLTYRDAGILDATHVRFFTLDGLMRLAETHGFALRDLHRTRTALEDSEMNVDANDAPESVRSAIAEGIPESRTYQFVARLERAAASATGWDGVGPRDGDVVREAALEALATAAGKGGRVLAVGGLAARAAGLLDGGETVSVDMDPADAAAWGESLDGGPFDTLILGDSLERTAHPDALLEVIGGRSLLAPGGKIFAVVTNASSSDAIADLARPDGPAGYGIVATDRVRFFTQASVEELFERHGFLAQTVGRVPVATPSPLTPALQSALASAPDAGTASLVIVAEPATDANELTRLRREVARLQGTQERLHRAMEGDRAASLAARAASYRIQEDLRDRVQRALAAAERQRSQMAQMRASKAWRLARSLSVAGRAVLHPVRTARSRTSKGKETAVSPTTDAPGVGDTTS